VARTARDAPRASFECVERPDANDALGESYTRFRRARDDITESALVEMCEVTSLIRFNRARHSIEVHRELVGIAARGFSRISSH
jgi:hypothetical protein